MSDRRPYSSPMLDGPDRAPSRAMLYAVGFEKEDFSKPLTLSRMDCDKASRC